MTIFEYLSVAISIVLSLSVAQLLSNIRAVLNPVRRYWVHISWTVLLLMVHVFLWWEFWGYRDVAPWNVAMFALILLNPGLLFVATNALVQPELGTSQSWEQHFFDIRNTFFLLLGILPVVSIMRRWILVDSPVLAVENLPEAFFIVICLVGLTSENRLVHAVLAVLGILTILAAGAFPWFLPGQAAH